MGALLGIDIGGTNIKTALVDPDGAVLSFVSSRWPGGDVSEAVETVVASREDLGEAVGAPTSVCGCACAGLVDRERGIVISSPNLPTWRDVELGGYLSERLGMPVVLENDANAAAFAEFKLGAARGARNAVMLTLGTGVGGGIVLGGALYRGSHGTAGEVGHSTIDMNGAPCICGSSGCLELLANADAIVARAAQLIEEGVESALAAAASKGDLSADDVGVAASRGDALALRALASVGKNLGIGLANISQILDPDVIVIGGGVAKAGEPLLGPAREELEARLSDCEFRGPRVVPAQLGETAGVVGAALLALSAPE